MDKHYYDNNTICEISSFTEQCRSLCANVTLSTKDIEYSWKTGIINTIVMWFEVERINSMPEKLDQIFAASTEKLNIVISNIIMIDITATNQFNNIDGTIQNQTVSVENLIGYLDEAILIPKFTDFFERC